MLFIYFLASANQEIIAQQNNQLNEKNDRVIPLKRLLPSNENLLKLLKLLDNKELKTADSNEINPKHERFFELIYPFFNMNFGPGGMYTFLDKDWYFTNTSSACVADYSQFSEVRHSTQDIQPFGSIFIKKHPNCTMFLTSWHANDLLTYSGNRNTNADRLRTDLLNHVDSFVNNDPSRTTQELKRDISRGCLMSVFGIIRSDGVGRAAILDVTTPSVLAFYDFGSSCKLKTKTKGFYVWFASFCLLAYLMRTRPEKRFKKRKKFLLSTK